MRDRLVVFVADCFDTLLGTVLPYALALAMFGAGCYGIYVAIT